MKYLIVFLLTCLSVSKFEIDAHLLTKRVVGGEIISISKAPWTAMIVKMHFGNFPVLCAGSILSKRAILTAAQCLLNRKSSELKVVLGTSRTDEITEANTYLVKTVIPHPEYSQEKFHNDIGVIIVDRDIDVTKLTPINLPPPEKQAYKNGCVAGWGSVEQGKMPSTDLREVCFTESEFTDCSQNWKNKTNNDIQLCVGSKGKDTCQGDSGAPLITEIKGKPTQIGIVSFGIGCGRVDSVYTRVSAYVDWIQKSVQNVV